MSSVCTAIQSKKILEFTYEGHFRVVEPYCHGTTLAGHPAFRGYQVGGTSTSATLGWKLFLIANATDLTITNKTFEIRAGFKKGDKGMKTIHCEV